MHLTYRFYMHVSLPTHMDLPRELWFEKIIPYLNDKEKGILSCVDKACYRLMKDFYQAETSHSLRRDIVSATATVRGLINNGRCPRRVNEFILFHSNDLGLCTRYVEKAYIHLRNRQDNVFCTHIGHRAAYLGLTVAAVAAKGLDTLLGLTLAPLAIVGYIPLQHKMYNNLSLFCLNEFSLHLTTFVEICKQAIYQLKPAIMTYSLYPLFAMISSVFKTIFFIVGGVVVTPLTLIGRVKYIPDNFAILDLAVNLHDRLGTGVIFRNLISAVNPLPNIILEKRHILSIWKPQKSSIPQEKVFFDDETSNAKKFTIQMDDTSTWYTPSTEKTLLTRYYYI